MRKRGSDGIRERYGDRGVKKRDTGEERKIEREICRREREREGGEIRSRGERDRGIEEGGEREIGKEGE